MWTSKNRARYDRSKLRYPSDLTDDEWKLVEPLIPAGKAGGGKRTAIMREVVMFVRSSKLMRTRASQLGEASSGPFGLSEREYLPLPPNLRTILTSTDVGIKAVIGKTEGASGLMGAM